jgi:hypothetical protein
MKKIFFILFFISLPVISHGQNNIENLKKQDELFKKGHYRAYIKQIDEQSHDVIKSWHKDLIYNSISEYLLKKSTADLIEAYINGDTYTYYPKEKLITLENTDSRMKDRINWLLGIDAGPCLGLGRGMSRLEKLEINKIIDDEYLVKGNLNDIVITGNTHSKNSLVLSKASIIIGIKTKLVDWECKKYQKYNNTEYCSNSILKTYKKNGEILSVEDISIKDEEFNKKQNLDILNIFPLKSIDDYRFGELVTYEDIPKKISLEKLTARSKKEAVEQRKINQYHERVNQRYQTPLIYRIVQGIVATATLVGIFVGIKIFKKRKLSSMPPANDSPKI